MNAYHISFAAFGVDNEDSDNDYVRARRYPVSPGGNFSNDTTLQPDYFQTGLFQPGIKYHMTIYQERTSFDNAGLIRKYWKKSFIGIHQLFLSLSPVELEFVICTPAVLSTLTSLYPFYPAMIRCYKV